MRHPRVAWEHLCVRCGLGHYERRTVGCGQQIAQLGCSKCKPKERCKECLELKRGKALGRCPKCKARNWRYRGLLVHDLRRTAVRTLRNAGIPEAVAVTITGLKTASCFRRYGIISNDDKVAALAQLQRWQQQQRANDCKLTVKGSADEALAARPVSEKVQ